MSLFSGQQEDACFFAHTVVAVLFRGRYYGALPRHTGCRATLPMGTGSVSLLLASDEAALVIAGRTCVACGQPLFCPEDQAAVVQLHAALGLPGPHVPAIPLQYQHARGQYEAHVDGQLVVIPWGTMAGALCKCLHAGLDSRRAFDAREWEEGAHGVPRFVVLKKGRRRTPLAVVLPTQDLSN